MTRLVLRALGAALLLVAGAWRVLVAVLAAGFALALLLELAGVHAIPRRRRARGRR